MIKVYKEGNAPSTQGTSLKGYIEATYNELVAILGEPTFNEPSGDNKVQVEWVVKFENKVFTIYDWKTYSREVTENELDRFHIGGKDYSGMLEVEISNRILSLEV